MMNYFQKYSTQKIRTKHELLKSYAEKIKAVKAEYKNLHGSDYNPRAVGAQAFWTAD